MALTKSGPAAILFYGVNSMTFADGDYDSSRAIPAKSIDIQNDQQLNDSVVRFERDQFELRTQASSMPCRYNTVGLEPMLELSIADIVFENIKLALGESGVLTAGAVDNPDKLSIEDNVGAEILGQRVQILPYPYPELYSVNVDKGTNDEFLNPFHSEYSELITDSPSAGSATLSDVDGTLNQTPALADINEFIAWRESIITFPNAAIVDINQIDIAFGLQTQQEIRVMLRGLPATDNSGIRIIFGSLDVTS